ncbi:MAG: hypothetical protein ACRBFS_20790 [Aureispira sp.]
MKKEHCTLYIKELRLKQSIATTFPEFYNPAALIILIILAKNPKKNEFIVIPKTLKSISNHFTFIEKNNERVLKRLSIDFLFKELPQNGFESFFFLMETNSTTLTPSNIIQQLKPIHSILPSLFPQGFKEAFFLQKMETLFKHIGYRSLFLLTINIPISNAPLDLIVSNDFVLLDATIESIL